MSELLEDTEILQFITQYWRSAITIKKDFFTNFAKNENAGDQLTQILELFLYEFGIDNFRQPDSVASMNISNLERYDDWMVKANICNLINAIIRHKMNSPTAITFGMVDLVKPYKKKTVRVLSILIQVWLQFTDLKDQWSKKVESQSSIADEKSRVLERVELLKKQCEEQSLQKAQLQNKNQHLDSKLSSIIAEYEEKKRIGKELDDNYGALKQEVLQTKEKISALSIEIGRLNEEISSLQGKIVRSPEKIQAETDCKERELESKRTEKRRLEKEYVDNAKKLDMIKVTIKELGPSMSCLQETMNELETICEKCNAIDKLRDTLRSKENKLKQLSSSKQMSETNISKLKEQIQKSSHQQKQKLKSLIDCNNQIKTQINEKTSTLTLNKRQEKMLEEERKLEKELESVRTSVTAFENKLESSIVRAKKGKSVVENIIGQLQ